jgi:cobalt ECF transporter T component CbiQ
VLEKTLTGSARIVRNTLFTDESARCPGRLQRIDARAKLVGLFAVLGGVALVHGATSLLALYAATIALAIVAGAGVRSFLARVWLTVPLFTAFVVLPATLEVVTPGRVVAHIGPFAVTEQGLTTAGLIVLRVATSVSFVALVVLTTTWHDLLGALRALHVPRVFVLVVLMAYRYIFQLLGIVDDVFVARRARVGRERNPAAARAFVAGSAGALFGRAHVLSEEVHAAMVARGFSGDVRTRRPLRVRGGDVVFSLAGIALALVAIGVDRGVR